MWMVKELFLRERMSKGSQKYSYIIIAFCYKAVLPDTNVWEYIDFWYTCLASNGD